VRATVAGVPAVEVLVNTGRVFDRLVDPDQTDGIVDFGRELDDRVLPAEAGLEERAISFTKGCYPGQEPIARQHYRGKVNRRLRVLEVAGAPTPETPVVHGDKEVGRVTSAVDGLALAYVRVEVPDDAELIVAGAPARLHWPPERP